jgi:hypothetical protein
MAAAGLIKFTAVMACAGMLPFIFILSLHRKQLSHFFCILSAYIVSILILLLATSQKLANFPSYLLNSYEVSDGYNSAMTVNGPDRQVFAGLCIVAMFAILLLNSILK